MRGFPTRVEEAFFGSSSTPLRIGMRWIDLRVTGKLLPENVVFWQRSKPVTLRMRVTLLLIVVRLGRLLIAMKQFVVALVDKLPVTRLAGEFSKYAALFHASN